jgi:hypothetical protein
MKNSYRSQFTRPIVVGAAAFGIGLCTAALAYNLSSPVELRLAALAPLEAQTALGYRVHRVDMQRGALVYYGNVGECMPPGPRPKPKIDPNFAARGRLLGEYFAAMDSTGGTPIVEYTRACVPNLP